MRQLAKKWDYLLPPVVLLQLAVVLQLALSPTLPVLLQQPPLVNANATTGT